MIDPEAALENWKRAGIVLDWETASHCDLKECGAWVYAEHPTTEILVLTWGWAWTDQVLGRWVPDRDGCMIPNALLELVNDPEIMFVAHNAQFEKAIWRRLAMPQYGWPDVPNKRWHDSMAVAAMKGLPQKLERLCTVLRLPYEKDKAGSALTVSLSKTSRKKASKGYYERTDAILDRVVEYNEADFHAQAALHKRLGYLPPGERQVWELDQRINERGYRIDRPLVDQMQHVVDRTTTPLAEEFRQITGGLEFTQRDKIMRWCRDNVAYLDNLQEETVREALGLDEDDGDLASAESRARTNLGDDAWRALYIRFLIGSASIKKLRRMRHAVCADGRARGGLQYHGAGPGRWAGRLIQPHNFPRGSAELAGTSIDAKVAALMTGDPDYVEAVLGVAPIEAVVSSLRHVIIAAPGRGLCVGDFAGIEARVVLALAGQHDKTALMASGVDVYCDMASQIYDRPINKKEHPDERQAGKNSVLGCGFQMGAAKFHTRYCPDKPREFAEQVIRAYREKWAPKVPDLWRALERAACQTAHTGRPHEAYGVLYQLEDGWMSARLPSGRKIWYWNPQPCRRAMPWDDTDIRPAWTYQTMKLNKWVTVDAYGGLLTENVVQGLARDLLVYAMFKCEREGLPIVLTVHDEIVAEPEACRCDENVLKQIMEDRPAWAIGVQVPVASECWTGDRYRK